MKRFRFRLQRVMQLREQIRDEARQELGRKNAARDHEISVLTYLEQEFERIGLVEGGTYSANDLVAVGDYGERLTNAIDKQKVVVAEAIKAAEVALERYIEASKNARAMEMLRDRKLEEFKQQVLREEGTMLDELAIQRNHRNEQY
jgi:flagellar FliJ protein